MRLTRPWCNDTMLFFPNVFGPDSTVPFMHQHVCAPPPPPPLPWMKQAWLEHSSNPSSGALHACTTPQILHFCSLRVHDLQAHSLWQALLMFTTRHQFALSWPLRRLHSINTTHWTRFTGPCRDSQVARQLSEEQQTSPTQPRRTAKFVPPSRGPVSRPPRRSRSDVGLASSPSFHADAEQLPRPASLARTSAGEELKITMFHLNVVAGYI